MTTAEQSDPGITADFTPCNDDQGQFLNGGQCFDFAFCFFAVHYEVGMSGYRVTVMYGLFS